MTDLTKLRELQEQEDSCDVYDPDCSCAGCEALAALATHLLPLAEALEEVLDEDSGDGIPLYAVEPARAKLKALKEALDA